MRRVLYAFVILLMLAPIVAALLGHAIGPGLLHPARLSPERLEETAQMLARTRATKEDFVVRAEDGVELRGWKIHSAEPNGDWVLLFHGVSDNRSGVLGHAEILLRHGYNVVMMDSRAHGQSGGTIATYGWKERWDTVAIVNALYASEAVKHLGALGVSMGAAIALQSAAVEPRIQAVVAESPFSSLREVSYDYAGFAFLSATRENSVSARFHHCDGCVGERRRFQSRRCLARKSGGHSPLFRPPDLRHARSHDSLPPCRANLYSRAWAQRDCGL